MSKKPHTAFPWNKENHKLCFKDYLFRSYFSVQVNFNGICSLSDTEHLLFNHSSFRFSPMTKSNDYPANAIYRLSIFIWIKLKSFPLIYIHQWNNKRIPILLILLVHRLFCTNMVFSFQLSFSTFWPSMCLSFYYLDLL